MISQKLIIEIPTSLGGIRDLKFYNIKGKQIEVNALSNADVSFSVNNKTVTCSIDATFNNGTNLPYMAFGDGWESEEQEEDATVEWYIYFNQIVVLGKDISKIEFARDDNIDIKLYSEFHDTKEEVGSFNNNSGIYTIDKLGKPYVVAKKGNQFYYNKLGTNTLQLDIPKIELIPHWSGVGKATSKTSQTFTYTATHPGYVVMFAEGGTHNNAGDGRPTATFTAPRNPEDIYDTVSGQTTQGYVKVDYYSTDSNGAWRYGTRLNVYYLYPGEKVTIVGNNASGNGYCYCFVGIYRIDFAPRKYKFSTFKRNYSDYAANTQALSYTHPKDPKDKYMLNIQFQSTYSTSNWGTMSYTSTDNNQLVFPEFNANVAASGSGNVYARFVKLPPDKDFTVTAKQSKGSGTRIPTIHLIMSDMY